MPEVTEKQKQETETIERLLEYLPAGQVVYGVQRGKNQWEFAVIKDGTITTQATLYIARLLNRTRNATHGGVKTNEPDELLALVSIKLHGDWRILKFKKL